MRVNLDGKVALVTGSGGGIGSAIALKMAENGADVVINDVNEENGLRVLKEIEALGRKAIYLQADVSSVDEMNAMADKVVEVFGRIDILVNNAGVNVSADGKRPIHEFKDEDWDRIINIDLNGVYRCSKPIIKYMIQRKLGIIINIGSIAGLVPLRLQSAFVAAKAGVFELTKAMAIELAPYGIRVNAIAPGSIGIAGNRQYYNSKPEIAESLLSHIPMHRFGEPEEIAYPALFLASDEASYMTGSVVVVDGGWACGFSRDW